MVQGSGNFNTALGEPCADESYFVSERGARRWREQANLSVKISLGFHIIAAVMMRHVALPHLVMPLTLMHLTIGSCCVVILTKNPLQEFFVRYMFPVLLPIVPAAYAVSAQINVAQGDAEGIFISGVGFILVSMFGLLMDPGSKRLHIAFTIFYMALGFWAFSGHRLSLLLWLINGVAMLSSFAFTYFHKAQHLKLVSLEYNLLIRAAPAKIVRQAAAGHVNLNDVFLPRMRRCVCISSDWRDYQKLSVTVSEGALSSSLGDYYDMCERILSKSFPEGNFYTDWIADEFFVVIYAKDDHDDHDLVNQTLQFASDLIRGKQAFTASHGLPVAIDIGVSYGDALIGMMGPKGHQKATALGHVPGRSRRIQTAAKLIRMAHGHRDRVVFDTDVLMEISQPFSLHEFALEDGRKLRDIDSDRLYFLDPWGDDQKTSAA